MTASCKRATGHQQEFQHVVERAAVGTVGLDNRKQLRRSRRQTASYATTPSRARIQLMLPRSVLISPL